MRDFLKMMDFGDNQFGGALYNNHSIYSKSLNPTFIMEFSRGEIAVAITD
jgi:hypothetical protein